MKLYLIFTVFLVLYVNENVIASVFSEVKCIAASTACLTTVNNAFDFSGKGNCSKKELYFDCLLRDGCSKTDKIYKDQVKEKNFQGCDANGAISNTMIWTLTIFMFTAVRFLLK